MPEDDLNRKRRKIKKNLRFVILQIAIPFLTLLSIPVTRFLKIRYTCMLLSVMEGSICVPKCIFLYPKGMKVLINHDMI